MSLKNRTILIISPQSWGSMFLSKHHYALSLAKMGNRVYFLNPPETKSDKSAGQIDIEVSCTHHNLLLINHRLKFPFLLKFHALPLFHLLMSFHIKNILKKIDRTIDIVWSFDQGNLYPLNFFGDKPFKIFQPVDEPRNPEAIRAAVGSQLILSVTREILQKYDKFEQPKHLINHGIAEDFLSAQVTDKSKKKNTHIGLSGNLLRDDIDREILLKIIDQNPSVVFEYWGPCCLTNNNIGGSSTTATKIFIDQLRQKNVVIHGTATPAKLARELQRMDAFLICYDINKDQSKGTNYHKIMEYLSTGKVVISNNVTAYADKPWLVQMNDSRDNNHALPLLFKEIIYSLSYHNNPVLTKQRKEYAAMNTYSIHIDAIGRIVANLSIRLTSPRQSWPMQPFHFTINYYCKRLIVIFLVNAKPAVNYFSLNT